MKLPNEGKIPEHLQAEYPVWGTQKDLRERYENYENTKKSKYNTKNI